MNSAYRMLETASLATVVTVGLFGACSSAPLTPLIHTPEIVQGPSLGEQRTVEVGDTLVSSSRVTRLPAIQLHEPIEAEHPIRVPSRLSLAPGVLVARFIRGGQTCYAPQDEAGRSKGDAVACLSSDGGAPVVIDPKSGSVFRVERMPSVEKITVIDRTAAVFQQELLYVGKAGSIVKFLYREFISEQARPAFTQEAQYDLRDGVTVGFKNARIEIITATNTNITYRVLSHFPPPPK